MNDIRAKLTMSFTLPQERARLSYSQGNLGSFQLRPEPVPPRTLQGAIPPPYPFQSSELPHPHPHPEGINGLSQANTSSPVPRDNSLPISRAQDAYILQLQDAAAAHSLAPPPPPQPQSVSPHQNGRSPHQNGNPPQIPDPQTTSNPPTQSPPLEIAQMTRPPEGTFSTFEALLAAANQHAFAHGYAFVIGRSKKKNKLGLKKVLLSCDKGGTSHHKMLPLDSELRKRKTTTRKTGCEFGVYAIESQQEWTLKYRPDPACALHNHGPSKSVTEHPAARKLNPSAIAAVKAMKDAGVSAQDTLKEIQREQPGTLLIARDVYNARAALRREPERPIDPALTPGVPGPQIYRRATMTPEERLRDDLRLEVTKAREELDRVKEECNKKIQELQNQLAEKDKQIEKFEMFIDICNQRVMVQRERLTDTEPVTGAGGA